MFPNKSVNQTCLLLHILKLIHSEEEYPLHHEEDHVESILMWRGKSFHSLIVAVKNFLEK